MSTFIIAEAGIGHNGNIDTAYRLVDVAQDAGADAVKFQTFWGLTNHPTLTDEELHALELTKAEWTQLKDYCDKVGIEFMSTPDIVEAVEFLADLGMKKCKVGSGALRNFAVLGKIRMIGFEKLIVSTGMHTRYEIKEALIALGIHLTFDEVYIGDNLTTLYCVSEYPAQYKGFQLWKMAHNKWKCSCRHGLSDHTLGIEIPIAAVALGASIIEKHFTLDKSMKGPDHAWALDPTELKEMIRCIRNVELALTGGVLDGRNPTPKELELRAQLENMKGTT